MSGLLAIARLRKKREVLTLQTKGNIIREVSLAGGKRGSQSTVARKYGLSTAGLTQILRNRGKLLGALESGRRNNGSTKGSAHPDLESRLIEWCNHIRSTGVPLSGPLICEQARAKPSSQAQVTRQMILKVKS